jgi:NADPH:quinone reductase-like Zn-dependent oxidoreductase
MKSIILEEAGSANQLKIADIPKPTIKDNELLVKVASISVNPVDYKVRSNVNSINRFFGTDRPVILGWDISGTVVESKSKSFKVGDEVFGMVNFPGKGNAYAEYVAANADHMALKPSNISHNEAAAASLACLTAWQVLQEAQLKAHSKVLIYGASGGVGHYATQIANFLGYEVTGVSSEKNKAFVLSNGAHHHIDYSKADAFDALADFDLVVDVVGKSSVLELARPLANGGKLITIVNHNIPEKEITYLKTKGVEAFSLLVQSSGRDMAKIADLLERGVIRSHVSHIYDFQHMVDAHLQLETGRTIGKIVVEVN